jgi:hypothetical protein
MKLGPQQAVKDGLLSTSLGFTQAPAQWPVLSGAQCLWHIVVSFSRFVFGVLIFPAWSPGVAAVVSAVLTRQLGVGGTDEQILPRAFAGSTKCLCLWAPPCTCDVRPAATTNPQFCPHI